MVTSLAVPPGASTFSSMWRSCAAVPPEITRRPFGTGFFGTDVADIVKARDGRYLDTFGRGQYQGVTRDHYVEVELPETAPQTGLQIVNALIAKNVVARNNKFCPKSEDAPALKGGGILLLGATHTVAARNAVAGNKGKQFNSGGIVVLSAKQLTHGRNPNHDTIAANHAFHNRPADLIWDGTGVGVHFVANHCGTSRPSGLCH